jgi:HlyD family secretion protein
MKNNNFKTVESGSSVDIKEIVKLPKAKSNKFLFIKFFILFSALSFGVCFYVFKILKPYRPGLLLSGYVEGYETDVSSKVAGKVKMIKSQEGEMVKVGQLIVKLDDAELQAQYRGASARVLIAREKVNRNTQQLSVLKARLDKANLITKQADKDSRAKVAQAQNLLSVDQAKLEESRAILKLSIIENSRTQNLFSEGAVSAQTRDEDISKVEVNTKKVNAALQQLLSSKAALEQAKSTLGNTSISASDELDLEQQILQAKSDVLSSYQEVRDAISIQQEVNAQIKYLNVTSPINGLITNRIAEPGVVFPGGKTLLTLVDLNRIYFRTFVPEGEIGKVRIGQKASIYLDSAPEKGLPASVISIDSQASFTPSNVYFRDDRARQVFGVKLSLKNPDGAAKPGMPADCSILIDSK